MKENIIKRDDVVIPMAKEAFENLGFLIKDQWGGDVTEVRVTDISFDDDIEILRIDDDSADVLMPVTVSFDAELVYDDLDGATYDSSEGDVFVHDQIEETVHRKTQGELEASVAFDGNDPKSFEIESVSWAGHQNVGIESSSNEGWPYK